MYITFKHTKIYYITKGNGNVPILFLHGWEGSSKSFDFITKYLNFNYKAIFIDFPPFGNSEEPQNEFTLLDYVDIVKIILKELNLTKVIIVGHSFGGRVAIVLSAFGYANKLILTDCAGMKVKHGIKYYYKIYKHKLLKKLGIKSNGGSKDYLKLSKTMRKTFVNIVNKNLEDYAKHISVPTIIFWGKKDKDTPLYMAKRLNKLIKNSELIIVNNAGHFAYIENFPFFVNTLNFFIKENL